VDGEGKVTAINAGLRSIVITHKDFSGPAINIAVRVLTREEFYGQ
jgi:uncharacterized protein YjdB